MRLRFIQKLALAMTIPASFSMTAGRTTHHLGHSAYGLKVHQAIVKDDQHADILDDSRAAQLTDG
jgi:hypothetical protein